VANNSHYSNDRTLTQVLAEIKNDLRDFLTTRFEMLRAELQEKLRVWKLSLPMIGMAVLLGIGAFMTFTFGLVALVARLIGTDYGWAWGALAVTVLYAIVASVFAYMGYREITAEGMTPNRTLQVLKQDQQWIKEEARVA
jgi:uncharacterized membrane protein YqjE